MNKYSSLIICVFFIVKSISLNFAQTKTNEAKGKVSSNSDYNPQISPVDSTALAILDKKIVPYNLLINKCYTDQTAKVINVLNPKDAVYYYGINAKGGVVIAITIEKL